MEDAAITNRELAALIIVGAIVLYAAWGKRGAAVRKSVVSVGAMLFRPPIVFVFGTYAAWILLSLIPANRLDLWNSSLLKSTILWLIFTGFGLIGNLSDAVRKPGYFRAALIRTVEVAAFLEFFAALKSFPLLIELPAQTLAVLMAGISVVAREPEHRQVRSLANGYLVVFGVSALIWAIVVMARDWNELDGSALLREFALPLWLTPVALIFVYVFAVYDAQRTTWRLLRLHKPEGSIWRQRSAALLRCNVRLGALRLVRGRALTAVARSDGFRSAWAEIAEERKRRRVEVEEEARAAQRLVDNAGRRGTDDEGRQFDQRQFVETRKALRWLSTCQMGQYRNNGGRYRSDIVGLAESMFVRDGLPEDHGVEVRTCDDGQGWYGWRQTPSGWWFAIGASGPPPDQWLCDGPVPPASFPTEADWDQFGPGKRSVNWD